MAEHTLVPERPEAEPGGSRHPQPARSVPGLRRAGEPGRREGWWGLALALALLIGFAVAAFLVVAVVAPSAGAVGGCGGG
jgi:hypothetical protein